MNNKEEIIVVFSADSFLEIKHPIELKRLGSRFIKKAILKSNNQKFKLTFYTVFTEIDFAIEQTKYIVNNIEKIINYKYDKQMLERIYVYDAYLFTPGKLSVRSITHSVSTVNAIVITHLPDEKISEFKSTLESDVYNNNPYFNTYSNLIKVEDSLGKFIMLYSLLSELLGHQHQRDLDKHYIRIQEPNVREEKTTKENKNYNETIYTHLRNRVGHLDKETDIDWLLQQVQAYLPGLKKMTKNAIENSV